MGLFDFLDMMGNYDDRAVDRSEIQDCVIDTCRVSDGAHPFETGVASKYYHSGSWVIVEAYDTEEDAQSGHDRWVSTMSKPFDELPEKLVDCQNAGLADLMGSIDSESLTFEKQSAE